MNEVNNFFFLSEEQWYENVELTYIPYVLPRSKKNKKNPTYLMIDNMNRYMKVRSLCHLTRAISPTSDIYSTAARQNISYAP